MEKMSGTIEVKQIPVGEIKLEREDLQMMMTLGVTLSGTYLDLLTLKEYLDKDQRFEIIYKTISAVHLRIVKRDQWDEFQQWRLSRSKE